MTEFINRATDLACLDEETAGECFYTIPRDRKTIEGPSVRLAEIVLSAWGNCRGGARIIAIEENFVVSQGAFHDLERNIAMTFEVRRRITNKRGERYSDDMISVTANAACSIALRDAIFRGIPKAFWKRIYDSARRTAIGDVKSLARRRDEMLTYFSKMGVDTARVVATLKRPSVDDVTLDDIATMKGIATALKDGDTTLETAFPQPESEKPKSGTKALKQQLKAKAAKKADVDQPQAVDRLGSEEPIGDLPYAAGTFRVGQEGDE